MNSTEPAAAGPRAENLARITLRPIGTSLPLGFLAMGGAAMASAQ